MASSMASGSRVEEVKANGIGISSNSKCGFYLVHTPQYYLVANLKPIKNIVDDA